MGGGNAFNARGMISIYRKLKDFFFGGHFGILFKESVSWTPPGEWGGDEYILLSGLFVHI